MIEKTFEEAWNNDGYQKIFTKLFGLYSKYIESHDALSMKMGVLWHCLEKFDASKGMKFESFLYSKTRFTILNYLKKNSKYYSTKHISALSTRDTSESRNQSELNVFNSGVSHREFSAGEKLARDKQRIHDLLMDLKESERDIIYSRYFEGLTLTELSQKYNIPTEAIRRKIKAILHKSKRLIN